MAKHGDQARDWAALEGKWSFLYGPVIGSVYGLVLCLIFGSMPVALTLVLAGIVWFGIALLCWFAAKISLCRQWREYHAALAANPVAWPWPKMPGDA